MIHKAKRNKTKEDPRKKNLPGFYQWYNHNAMVQVNQAVGRIKRNEKDFGAIFLVDDRYVSDKLCVKYLSSHYQELERKFKDFTVLQKTLFEFFKKNNQERFGPEWTQQRDQRFGVVGVTNTRKHQNPQKQIIPGSENQGKRFEAEGAEDSKKDQMNRLMTFFQNQADINEKKDQDPNAELIEDSEEECIQLSRRGNAPASDVPGTKFKNLAQSEKPSSRLMTKSEFQKRKLFGRNTPNDNRQSRKHRKNRFGNSLSALNKYANADGGIGEINKRVKCIDVDEGPEDTIEEFLPVKLRQKQKHKSVKRLSRNKVKRNEIISIKEMLSYQSIQKSKERLLKSNQRQIINAKNQIGKTNMDKTLSESEDVSHSESVEEIGLDALIPCRPSFPNKEILTSSTIDDFCFKRKDNKFEDRNLRGQKVSEKGNFGSKRDLVAWVLRTKGEECPVCYEEISEANIHKFKESSRCKHIACSECWEACLNEKLECGVCRKRTRLKFLTPIINRLS